jgi:hypothetical protein
VGVAMQGDFRPILSRKFVADDFCETLKLGASNAFVINEPDHKHDVTPRLKNVGQRGAFNKQRQVE